MCLEHWMWSPPGESTGVGLKPPPSNIPPSWINTSQWLNQSKKWGPEYLARKQDIICGQFGHGSTVAPPVRDHNTPNLSKPLPQYRSSWDETAFSRRCGGANRLNSQMMSTTSGCQLECAESRNRSSASKTSGKWWSMSLEQLATSEKTR